MKPFVARAVGSDEDLLVVGFTDHKAVVVKPKGALATVEISGLRVQYGTTDWPVGYAFSKAAWDSREAAA